MTARDFSGTTDRLDWASVMSPIGSAQTFSCWVDYDTLGTSRKIFTIQKPGDTDFALQFHHGGTSQQMVVFLNCTAGNCFRASSNVLTTGKHHVLYTWDGSNSGTNIRHYLDGSETSGSAGSGGTLPSATGSWSLGGYPAADNFNIDGRAWFAGFWNRILSADEIAALASGYHPSFFASGLQWCPDLSSLKDPYSGITGTADGTTTQDSVGPQILPCGPMIWTAAPAAGATWHSRLSRNSRLLQGKL